MTGRNFSVNWQGMLVLDFESLDRIAVNLDKTAKKWASVASPRWNRLHGDDLIETLGNDFRDHRRGFFAGIDNQDVGVDGDVNPRDRLRRRVDDLEVVPAELLRLRIHTAVLHSRKNPP